MKTADFLRTLKAVGEVTIPNPTDARRMYLALWDVPFRVRYEKGPVAVFTLKPECAVNAMLGRDKE